MARARGHGRGRETRTVLVLLLIVCVLGLAVLWARSRDPGTLRPPPLTPEQQARIDSSENAFNALREAMMLLPESKPILKKYPVPGKPGEMAFYETEADSIARELDIWAPDDAPEVAACIEQRQPAVKKAREALTSPYLLLPGREDDRRRFRVEYFLTLFRVSYRHAWEIQGDRDVALELLFDTIRLCRMLERDGDTDQVRSLLRTERKCWDQLISYLAETDDSAVLNYALEGLLRLEDGPRLSYERLIDAQWRSEWARLEDSFSRMGYLRRYLFLRDQRRTILAIVRRGETWRQVLELPYPRFEASVLPDPEEVFGKPEPFASPSFSLWVCKYDETCCIAVQRQVLLMTLLELHRRDRGEYPETLAKAVGERMESVPADPFTGKAFEYNPATPERLLVSPGPRLHPGAWMHPDRIKNMEMVNGVAELQRIGK